jgi:polar amino acid transport system permease protein
MPLLPLESWERLLTGAGVTLEVTFLSAVLGTAIGLLGGIAALSRYRLVRAAVRIYVEVFRGVSALILLFWAAFALPQLLHVELSILTAAVVALGTNMGAYCCELARGSIGAVPRGQTDAAIAVNLSAARRLRHVILPQALISMLPPYGNLLIEILKASALVSLLPDLDDIMRSAQILRNNRAEIGASTTEIYLGALLVYFLIARAIALGVGSLERRLSRGMDVGRTARAER